MPVRPQRQVSTKAVTRAGLDRSTSMRKSRQRGCSFGPHSTTPGGREAPASPESAVGGDCWSSSISTTSLTSARTAAPGRVSRGLGVVARWCRCRSGAIASWGADRRHASSARQRNDSSRGQVDSATHQPTEWDVHQRAWELTWRPPLTSERHRRGLCARPLGSADGRRVASADRVRRRAGGRRRARPVLRSGG